jgi:hypothetical protein
LKPLSEWPRDDLLVCVFESHPNAQSALGELLRRERERCAELCERIGGEYDYPRAVSAYRAASAIRGLQ